MTRINVGIPPAELTDKHLLAEHREIKRIPNCIAKGKYNMDGIPVTLNSFTINYYILKIDILDYIGCVKEEGLMFKII